MKGKDLKFFSLKSKPQKKENKFIYKEVLVFPGYMFVAFDITGCNWNNINSTYGVSKVLAFNNKPSEISYDLIEVLKNRYEVSVQPIPKQKFSKRGFCTV